MTHDEVIDTAMDLWNYVAVCEFFLLAIRQSASAVNGGPAPRYSFGRGLDIVGIFPRPGRAVRRKSAPRGEIAGARPARREFRPIPW